MEFHRERKEPPSNVQTNYLWEKTPGSWAIVLNYDKIENKRESKGYDREIFDLSDEIPGVTNGKKLNVIINESLKAWKREWVLCGVKTYGLPMGKSSYNAGLASAFKPKKPTQNILRKSYINHWHHPKLKLSHGKLKEIARRMRHTINVALSAYKKVNIDCPEPGDIEGLTVIPKVDVPKPIKKQPKEYFDPKTYSKQYREKNAVKIKEQRKLNYSKNKEKILRSKILWNLNHMTVTHPRKETVERYDLKYNAKIKQWE